jgi:hypothetical protein
MARVEKSIRADDETYSSSTEDGEPGPGARESSSQEEGRSDGDGFSEERNPIEGDASLTLFSPAASRSLDDPSDTSSSFSFFA